jgi:hypothetical protein
MKLHVVDELRPRDRSDEETAGRAGGKPDVLFLDDLARELRCSRRTLETRRRNGTLPIPELPSIDKRPRWSRAAVERYLDGYAEPAILRRRGRR